MSAHRPSPQRAPATPPERPQRAPLPQPRPTAHPAAAAPTNASRAAAPRPAAPPPLPARAYRRSISQRMAAITPQQIAAYQPRAADRALPHPARPVPPPPPAAPRRALPQRPPQKRLSRWWLLLIPAFMGVMLLVMGGVIVLGVGSAYARGVLPGVYVGEVALGGLSESTAASKLRQQWSTLVLRANGQTWRLEAAASGIMLDAAATAATAYDQGRGTGNPLAALWGQIAIPPALNVDAAALRQMLDQHAPELAVAPVNAGVALVNGRVQATPPQAGQALDPEATINRLLADPAGELADGALDVVMAAVAPAVTDASPIVAEAERLLTNPLDIRLFDPVTGDSVYWSLPPQQWGAWLTAVPDATSAIGLRLTADAAQVRAYLTEQTAQTFDASRSVDIEQGVQAIITALAAGKPADAYLIVRHLPRSYTVKAGETITSIAWDFGIPYLYIVEANGGLQNVSIGQTITLPPADQFLLKPVVPHKRIVVSISQQKTWVYENEQLKWEWVSSTGINDSPTWPGVYQIISHEPNAYAGNWNLWMPYFMGVYQPIPGAEFTNGFHGFPTRGGGQLLWENSLGRKVTYGCILLNNTNAKLLYDWAEEGVVVVIEA